MPYKPNQYGEVERSRMYPYMWAAAAASPVNLALAMWGFESGASGIIFGLTTGGLVGTVFRHNSDEFMQTRVIIGMRFVMGALLLCCVVAWTVGIFDLGRDTGHALASGAVTESQGGVHTFQVDALVVCSAFAVVFYVGYIAAVIKERFF